MKDILEKLSSYNIFNYLFPGVLFAAMSDIILTSNSLLLDDNVVGVFFYYFYGIVISRVGSLLIEPFLRWAHIIHFAPYTDFITASKLDHKIELLSESNNMYRTLISVFFCLLLLSFFEYIEQEISFLSNHSLIIAVLVLLILFALSYRKQTAYLKSRIMQVNESKNTSNGNDEEAER